MKKSQKITFSSVMAALGVTVMLAAYFPYLTFAVPAIAGLCVLITFIEAGPLYAVGAYAVSGVLTFVFCEKEAALLYILFFGIYPVFKAYFEKIRIRALEIAVKFIYLNAVVFADYYLAKFVLGMEDGDLFLFGKWVVYLLILLCNIAFIVYDRMLSSIAAQYVCRFQKTVHKTMGIRKR